MKVLIEFKKQEKLEDSFPPNSSRFLGLSRAVSVSTRVDWGCCKFQESILQEPQDCVSYNQELQEIWILDSGSKNFFARSVHFFPNSQKNNQEPWDNFEFLKEVTTRNFCSCCSRAMIEFSCNNLKP